MFAAVVRVLLLLGCVPLLHPPGVCACRAWAAVLPAPDADHHDHHDDGDCPHCPGATADAATPRAPDSAPDPVTLSVPVVAAAAAAAPVVVGTLPRTSAAWPSAPPLYLSHCALVC
ncbi:hypothetical protein [Urbifossiella limnaea]|uniref:DUF2946 domain-containing protein n=1 Tax=Urbifossiella limnaea TaxID=2528023 RepID=A0A517XML7_9BACT|nr:hypothetical protein [Urbifossiella limnaea]QDU18743.1 hypothetical protein ETAA1_06390 [Urbifossiella limnaea]